MLPFHRGKGGGRERKKTSFGHRETQSGLRAFPFPSPHFCTQNYYHSSSIFQSFRMDLSFTKELFLPWFLILYSIYPFALFMERTISKFRGLCKLSPFLKFNLFLYKFHRFHYSKFHHSHPLFLNLFLHWFRELSILQSYQRFSIIYYLYFSKN